MACSKCQKVAIWTILVRFRTIAIYKKNFIALFSGFQFQLKLGVHHVSTQTLQFTHTYMAKTNSLFNIFTIITTIESIVCMLRWKIETKENLRLREHA